MASTRKRDSGSLFTQPTGYRAFIPRPLPLEPPLEHDDHTLQLLERATLSLGRLDGCARILPDPDLFVYMYIRKEAVLSSQIEGTQASLQDVLEFEESLATPDADVEEVLNYVEAMNYGLDRLQSLPMSLRLIREIHAKLMAGVRGKDRHPGEFRTTQNWIGPAGSSLATATFVPPPPAAMLDALSNLEHFVHSEQTMPALIKAGVVHAQFETIHPFLDGNGRLGRLLITFSLCQQSVMLRPLLYLSTYFNQNKADYYALLQATRDTGDWEAWIRFFLTGIAAVSNEAADSAMQITELREKDRRLIATGRRGSPAAAQLLEHLYARPIVDVNSVARATNVSYQNANELVRRFCDLNILTEFTGRQRDRQFSYDAYLAILRA
jgi:Fic family protein